VTLFPCADCARGVVQVGINRVVYHEESTLIMQEKSTTWDESYNASMRMFNEAGVEVVKWNGDIVIPEGKCQGVPIYFS
jgi:deoxycytidylate deaminase